MPNPLCAKSLNPDASGSLCNFVSELSRRTRQVMTLAPRHLYPGEPPTAGGLNLRADCRCRSLAAHVSACYPGTIDANSGSLLVLGFF
jgi:hypothetical protein